MTKEEVIRKVCSDKTPLHGNNKFTECEWCKAKWPKPQWNLEPYPLFFGHPYNSCEIWKYTYEVSPSRISKGCPNDCC
jgi:hypothetical protein